MSTLRMVTVSTDDHGGDIQLDCPTCGTFCEMPATDETQGTRLDLAQLVARALEHDCKATDD